MSETGKLERAYLQFGEPSSSGKKGADDDKRFEFMFNPKEISITKAVEWKAKASKKPTMPEYAGTKPATITVEMFLDASEGGDVTTKINKLLDKMEPHAKTKKDKPSPPFCSFGWGVTTYIANAVVKTVVVKYTRFKPDGTPIRAVATVTLEELRPGTQKTNPTSGSPDAEVERIVRPGDTLQSIAWEELGAASLWRAVAQANGVDDPFRLQLGSSIIIPSLAALDSEKPS
jgi:nucleoid-associated protein YgaU